jgi:outer membrane protein TolC
MIANGQLRLTVMDAVELALENNIDIAVQRYNSWLWETDILRGEAGQTTRGVATTGTANLFAALPQILYDPSLSVTMNVDDRVFPVNNPLTAGTGTGTTTSALTTHNAVANFAYNQGFVTGTTLSVGLNNTRNSTSSAAVRFNPNIQTLGSLAFAQQLLNGFGRSVNERFLKVARIGKLASDYAFQQSVITDITAVQNDYWELVFARDNVAVQQRSVDLAQRLLEDNQRQVEIGTLAPIEVVRAQAQVASAQQSLINAQSVQLQQQTLLMSVITKDPVAPAVRDVEIIPVDTVENIPRLEDTAINDLVTDALSKRPDVLQAKTNLGADDINVQTTKQALLPNLVASGFINGAGLSGVSVVNGVRIPAGWFDATGQIFQGAFPEYQAQIALLVPIRNRPAQADNARALLVRQQDQERLQLTYNGVAVDVRNAQISLRESRVALDAAQKNRELQEQTLTAEQTKFQLGASTPFLVISSQQSLASAASAQVRAQVNLAEALVNFERATGRTLEANRITLSDAKSGTPARETLIPGTNIAGQIIGQKASY